jgi:hypothetical protein
VHHVPTEARRLTSIGILPVPLSLKTPFFLPVVLFVVHDFPLPPFLFLLFSFLFLFLGLLRSAVLGQQSVYFDVVTPDDHVGPRLASRPGVIAGLIYLEHRLAASPTACVVNLITTRLNNCLVTF